MNLTLLLDLDVTLLDTNLATFIPAYFQALSGYLSNRVNPDLMLSALLSGTRKMIESSDPTHTLQQVFNAEFFPKIGLPREELQPLIDQFYEEEFPKLSYLTSPRPEAIDMVTWAVQQRARLAIATNPLYPLAAIHHRMRWAGLSPEEIPFSVIPAYEAFHFAKPNPAYFAEVLGHMGWPEGPVVMVGDDLERDLPGCLLLGLPFFWINVSDIKPPPEIAMSGHGLIADLRTWLEEIDLSILEPIFSAPESLIAIMLSTPAVISGLLTPLLPSKGVGDSVYQQRPFTNEWNLAEIFCHLRDTELEINLPRLRMLLELEEPFIPARDSDAWAVKRDYFNQDASLALSDFTTARVETINLLRSLKGEWKRKARHAIFGPTDLQELVKFMAEHDKLHLRQILSIIEMFSG